MASMILNIMFWATSFGAGIGLGKLVVHRNEQVQFKWIALFGVSCLFGGIVIGIIWNGRWIF